MKIREIFCSIQGEGRQTGTAAIFVRFSGCNLHCSFCDEHHDTGVQMTEEQIVEECKKHLPVEYVVLTGGEPTLQVTESLVDKLHREGFTVAIETNGTNEVLPSIDWVTLSPKICFDDKAVIKASRCNEIKIVYDGKVDVYDVVRRCPTKLSTLVYLQPCDTGNEEENKRIIDDCVSFVKQHPEWRISAQLHKYLKQR